MKNTPNQSEFRTKNSQGIANWTRLDANEMNPLFLDNNPNPDNLQPQQANPASSRNLPSIEARDPAVREFCEQSEGTLVLPMGNNLCNLTGLANREDNRV